MLRKWHITGVLAMLITASVSAQKGGQQIEQTEKPFVLKLGSTRVIYNPGSSGATLTVSNDQDYPMLVKSDIFDEDKKAATGFIITPPLFRLDGHQQSRMSILNAGGKFPADRESLQWLCVKGIPPKADDEWAKGGKGGVKPSKATLNIQISVSSCIKLFVRPEALRGTPVDVTTSLSWQRQGNKLHVTNPTPFYMNMQSITVGGKTVSSPDYIKPFDSHDYVMPEGSNGRDVEWKIITDLGGTSRPYKDEIK